MWPKINLHFGCRTAPRRRNDTVSQHSGCPPDSAFSMNALLCRFFRQPPRAGAGSASTPNGRTCGTGAGTEPTKPRVAHPAALRASGTSSKAGLRGQSRTAAHCGAAVRVGFWCGADAAWIPGRAGDDDRMSPFQTPRESGLFNSPFLRGGRRACRRSRYRKTGSSQPR